MIPCKVCGKETMVTGKSFEFSGREIPSGETMHRDIALCVEHAPKGNMGVLRHSDGSVYYASERKHRQARNYTIREVGPLGNISYVCIMDNGDRVRMSYDRATRIRELLSMGLLEETPYTDPGFVALEYEARVMRPVVELVA